MDDDLHNEDKYFRKAYRTYNEEPSAEVWENINAKLDKTKAANNSKRFVVWKRIACILLLLAGSAGAYQLFVAKADSVTNISLLKKEETKNKTAAQHQPETNKNTLLEEDKNRSSGTIHSFDNDKLHSKNKSEIYSNRDYNQHSYSKVITENRKQKETAFQSKWVSNKAQALQQNDKTIQVKQNQINAARSTAFNSSIDDNTSVNQFEKKSETLNKKDELITDTASTILLINNALDAKHDSITTALAAKTIHVQAFKKYWTIMPFVSADFTQYMLDDDATANNNTPENKHDIEQRERHQFSFSAGMAAKRQLTKKLSVKSGLLYSNVAIGIQPQTLYAAPDGNQNIAYKFVTSSGYAYVKPVFGAPPARGDSITSDVSKHHLQYLTVPLLIGYKIRNGKHFAITPEAGMSANVLVSTRVRTELNENSNKETVIINKLQGVRNVYYSFTADAELLYRINRHISFVGFPVFKYAINSINKNNVVKTYPYSFSVAGGISYRF